MSLDLLVKALELREFQSKVSIIVPIKNDDRLDKTAYSNFR